MVLQRDRVEESIFTVILDSALCPLASVTYTVTVYVPGVLNVCEGEVPPTLVGVPSPKFQLYESGHVPSA